MAAPDSVPVIAAFERGCTFVTQRQCAQAPRIRGVCTCACDAWRCGGRGIAAPRMVPSCVCMMSGSHLQQASAHQLCSGWLPVRSTEHWALHVVEIIS